MKLEKSKLYIWLFRLLVVATVALMVFSFTQPWWVGRFVTGETIHIYGWGLRHNLNLLANYIAEDVTPIWQTILAWVYLGTSATLVLISTKLRKWWGAIIPGAVGLGFTAYAYIAMNVVISHRLKDFRIPLEGFTDIDWVTLYSSIQNDYYLTYIAGGLLIFIAVFRVRNISRT